MKRRIETTLCTALSAALHLGALAAVAMTSAGGAPQGGVAGAMTVTLVAPPAADEQTPAPDADPASVAPPDPAPVDPAPQFVPDQPASAPRLDAADAAVRPDDAATTYTALRPRARPARPERQAADPGAQTPSPARQIAQAAGTGGGPVAGARGSAAFARGDASAEADARRIWGARIQQLLQRRLATPRMSRGGGDSRLVISLSVAPDGWVRAASILHSSGVAALDAATLSGLARLGRLPPAPSALTAPAYVFNAPVVIRAR